MVLPFVKLAALGAKTLAKPIARRLKDRAATNPSFRQACINSARAYHRFGTKGRV